MKYRINRNFADKYKGGNNKEGLFLTLEYVLRKCDSDGDINRIREGDAQDIDGIISILLEYGFLEEVDSEEEDEDSSEGMFEAIKKKFEDNDSSHKDSVMSLLSAEPTSPWIDRVILQIKGEYSLYMFSAPAPEKRNAEGLLSECLEHVKKCNKKAKEDSDKKYFEAAGKLIDETILFMCEAFKKLEGLQESDGSLSLKHKKDFKDHMEFMMKRYK